MSPEVLERFISQYVASQDVPEVLFAWQGGEPTLLDETIPVPAGVAKKNKRCCGKIT